MPVVFSRPTNQLDVTIVGIKARSSSSSSSSSCPDCLHELHLSTAVLSSPPGCEQRPMFAGWRSVIRLSAATLSLVCQLDASSFSVARTRASAVLVRTLSVEGSALAGCPDRDRTQMVANYPVMLNYDKALGSLLAVIILLLSYSFSFSCIKCRMSGRF